MDFQPDDTQLHIRELAQGFVKECVASEAKAWERDGKIPEEFLTRMARQGFLGMVAPPQFGGSGIDPVGFVLASMEIAAASSVLGLVMSINNQVCDTVNRAASEEQKQRLLPELVAGGQIGSIALSETQAGSNVTAIQTSARKVEGGYVLNGKKVYVSNGAFKGIALVCARTSQERRRGLTFFMVDKDADGTKRQVMDATLGLRAASMTVHSFKDCFVREEDRLGEEGSGFDIIQTVMGMGRLGVAAQCVGIARAAFDLALRHAKSREQFGGPLAELQAVQFSLADMATAIDAAELMTLRAAWVKAQEKPYATEAAMAKLLASEAAGRVTDAALQIHGGAGYFDAAPIARLYADARGTRIYEGTSEIMKILIARDIIGALK
ncbi:MAG: acyl-CoA dehydrogenase family protein [Nitrospinota bacterium]